MQRGALRDATVPEPHRRQSQSTPQAQRLRVAFGLVVALALITAAWVIGGRLGFEQIGAGGINLSLLPKIGQPAPDFVTLTAADGQPVRLVGMLTQPPLFLKTTRLALRSGILWGATATRQTCFPQLAHRERGEE